MKGRNPRRFGEPGGYVGTSMAAAHASGVAAMVLAGGVIPANASPEGRVNRVLRRLRQTARDIGEPHRYEGAGLIDAGAADRTAAVGGPQVVLTIRTSQGA